MMRLKKKKLSFFLLFSFSLLMQLCNAQPAKFRHLNIDQGLSQNSVQDIVQDPFGFMWIATQDGLNRYDGYDFQIYKNDPRDSTSLSTNYLKSLCIDPDSSIWIGTRNRILERYDPF